MRFLPRPWQRKPTVKRELRATPIDGLEDGAAIRFRLIGKVAAERSSSPAQPSLASSTFGQALDRVSAAVFVVSVGSRNIVKVDWGNVETIGAEFDAGSTKQYLQPVGSLGEPSWRRW